ncbi:MAG: class I SAM-dependent methyltransferase [Firmicutes bacterium]|jgi:demethylmenaquinone methyltransferase/2-methoxy-6-polyprenyl-1,4-benzoquinol methylase|nr:class I SAM-dependent methyltransferase [Bacillota bacterium]MCL5015316.1 class I SAM-dependent methyltransferase [Bacillota bacterium]
MSSNEDQKKAPKSATPALFDVISPHYDRWSDLLSAGGIRAWHHVAVERMQLSGSLHVLDVGCGTGTVTRQIALKLGPQGRVTGLDPATGMLDVARTAPIPANAGPIQWVHGSGEQLPFGSETFDRVSAQFSLRNMGDWTKGLQEMMRVLKVGGQLTILEMVQPLTRLGIMARQGLNAITARISGPKLNPYQWLAVSLQHAPSMQELRTEAMRLGLIKLSVHQWLGDLVVLLTGVKAPAQGNLLVSNNPHAIVWGIDGSLTSLRGGSWINRFIQEGSVIHLVTVLPESYHAEEIQKTDRQYWQHQHMMAENLLTAGKFQNQITVLEGEAGPTLVEFSQHVHASMIVMGNRHRNDIPAYWQESASRYVSAHSLVPVLLVPTEYGAD